MHVQLSNHGIEIDRDDSRSIKKVKLTSYRDQ